MVSSRLLLYCSTLAREQQDVPQQDVPQPDVVVVVVGADCWNVSFSIIEDSFGRVLLRCGAVVASCDDSSLSKQGLLPAMEDANSAPVRLGGFGGNQSYYGNRSCSSNDDGGDN